MSMSLAIRRLVAGLACCATLLPSIAFADGRFEGAKLLVGKERIGGTLTSDAKKKEVSFDANGNVPFRIPAESIKSIYYERTSKPRYAAGLLIAWPLLFTRSKQHYLTIQYTDTPGDGKFQIVQLDKSNVRTALETIEADTGIKIDRSAER
jgi:hypothetical protein